MTQAPVDPGPETAPDPGADRQRLKRFLLRDAGVFLALIVIVLVFSFTAPYFATSNNALKIFVQIAINTVLAAGMTFVILTAGIDLSVGSVLALCTVVGALIMTSGMSPVLSIPLAILGCIAVGGLCGFINGKVSTYWKVPSFIVTLGMLNIAAGAARVLSDNSTITGLPQGFVNFGNLIIGGFLPSIFLIAVAVIALGWFILRFTVFGRMIYAVGANDEAVRLSGVNTDNWKMAIYALAGSICGIAGLLIASRQNSAQPAQGLGYELDAIAAVVIGGTSLAGGRGTVLGTVIGALIMAVLTNGLRVMKVQPEWQTVATGAIIIMAVYADQLRRKAR